MISLYALTMVVGKFVACIGPFYCCKKLSVDHVEIVVQLYKLTKYNLLNETYDLLHEKGHEFLNGSEQIENESPLVHIKLSHPYRCQFSNDTSSDGDDSNRNSIDSNNAKKVKQDVQEAEAASLEEAQIVHLKPPQCRHRISTRMWSASLRDQLGNIRKSSSEICDGTTEVVQAQIEANSKTTSQEEPSKSLRLDRDNPSGLVLGENYLTDRKARKLSSAAVKKWKKMKQTFICSRPNKSMLFEDIGINETQRLNPPVPASNQCSPTEQLTVLQRSRLVDVSTSTRISSNVSKTIRNNDENLANHESSDDSNETPSLPIENDRSRKEAMQEVVSLIKRQCVNGKSICDVRISGLEMNQSQLLDLFEATGDKTSSASIVTTEEASIISIKFHHRRTSNDGTHAKDGSSFDGSFWKFYKSLPERFEDMSFPKLFQSKRSNLATPSIQISDHSRNETSYKAFPNARKRVADRNLMVDRSISNEGARFSNNRVRRFVADRQM